MNRDILVHQSYKSPLRVKQPKPDHELLITFPRRSVVEGMNQDLEGRQDRGVRVGNRECIPVSLCSNLPPRYRMQR
jgi:hypothetical protein